MNKTELVAANGERNKPFQERRRGSFKIFHRTLMASELKKRWKNPVSRFGTFEVSERAAREGRNPQTGETMTIAASKAPKFKAGKALKDLVNE